MRNEIWIYATITIAVVFVLTLLITRILIPKLKSLKVGQKILDIGPRWHKNKEGTPTMGGIAFLISSTFAMLTIGIYLVIAGKADHLSRLIITLLFALVNGMIGIIDDSAKLLKKENQGLTAKSKYLFQLAAAGVYLASMKLTGNLETSLVLPFFNQRIELGWFYYVFALVLITGVVNSVNLTDGLDGLASTVTFGVAGFFLVVSCALASYSGVFVSSILIGICLGFLVFNFYPAKIFMGDTGSLFLGGMVVGLAFLIDSPLIVLLCGIIYILEAASVILQVFYFKLTHGKRLFKMAPIHHHFEKCGWSEVKVVTVFFLVTIVFGVVSWFGIDGLIAHQLLH